MLVASVKFFRCQFEDKTAGHAEAALGSVADKTVVDINRSQRSNQYVSDQEIPRDTVIS